MIRGVEAISALFILLFLGTLLGYRLNQLWKAKQAQDLRRMNGDFKRDIGKK